ERAFADAMADSSRRATVPRGHELDRRLGLRRGGVGAASVPCRRRTEVVRRRRAGVRVDAHVRRAAGERRLLAVRARVAAALPGDDGALRSAGALGAAAGVAEQALGAEPAPPRPRVLLAAPRSAAVGVRPALDTLGGAHDDVTPCP